MRIVYRIFLLVNIIIVISIDASCVGVGGGGGMGSGSLVGNTSRCVFPIMFSF